MRESDFDYEITDQRFGAIGRRGLTRLDGHEKASGAAVYATDVRVPGMLFARILTSPYAHALIKGMDCSRAEAYPGVRAVLRSDDPEIKDRVAPGSMGAPWFVLPGYAAWEGEPVGAVVAADSVQACDEALKLIDVEWERFPFVLDEEEATRRDDVRLTNEGQVPKTAFDAANDANPYANITSHLFFVPTEEHTFEQGSVAAGFAEADRIMEFKARRWWHTWAEPELPMAITRLSSGYAELWVKHQHVYEHRQAMSHWFDLPMNRVTAYAPYQGAMFGGWNWMNWSTLIHYVTSILSRRTNRPVKLVFNRRDDFYGGSMDCAVHRFKVGAKKDGTITAVAIESVYANGPKAPEPALGIAHFVENSRIPNLFKHNIPSIVNKGPVTAVRCEQLANTLCFNLVFSHVAGELGLDPTEVALKNDGSEGRDTTFLSELKKRYGKPDRDSLRECIEAGKKLMAWDEKYHTPGARKLPSGKMHGVAFIWDHEWNSRRGAGTAGILFEPDGSVSLLGQHIDVGVSSQTAYCQIAADEIGMRYEDVVWRPQNEPGFALMTPDGSCNLCANGHAIRRAARKAKKDLLEFAAHGYLEEMHSSPPAFPGYEPDQLDIKDSVIYVKEDPTTRKPVKEVVHEVQCVQYWKHPQIFNHSWKQSGGWSDPSGSGGMDELATYSRRPQLGRQTHFMEVEVDTETGEIEVTKVVNVNDVGKVINPEAVEGQQYGGSIMAVSRSRFEEVVWDMNTGVMLNGNLIDYKIATILDCGPIETAAVETGLGYGPYGTNGIGEDVGDHVTSLLGPAVYNALGVAVDDFPITPAKVLKALGKI